MIMRTSFIEAKLEKDKWRYEISEGEFREFGYSLFIWSLERY